MKTNKTAKKRFKLSNPKNKKLAKLIHAPQGIAHLMSKRTHSKQERQNKERSLNKTAKNVLIKIISS